MVIDVQNDFMNENIREYVDKNYENIVFTKF